MSWAPLVSPLSRLDAKDSDAKQQPSALTSGFTLKLFPSDVALAAIAILTFGDSLSHLVGKLGKRKNLLDASKNIEGGLVGVLVGTAAASFFVSFLFAFIASVLAMLAEALSLKLQEEEVDDNIIIPLVAGTVLFLLQRYV